MYGLPNDMLLGYSVFYLYLDEEAWLRNSLFTKSNLMSKNTILWADDDYDDLQLMQEVLGKKHSDFKIIEVHNGKEALDFLEQSSHVPCLIILDINMPVLDGKETLSILKNTEKYKNIPVVMFTTSQSELDKIYCSRFNTEMVTKPPTFNTLSTVLDKLLAFCR